MADPAGVLLFDSLRRELMALLGEACQALEEAGRLDGLGPAGPEWAQTALAGHLLAPIQELDAPQPGVAAVLRQLAALAPADATASLSQAGLHGWDPGSGGRPGLALAMLLRTDAGAPPAPPLAAALVVGLGETGPLLSLVASGTGAIGASSPVAIALGRRRRWTSSPGPGRGSS